VYVVAIRRLASSVDEAAAIVADEIRSVVYTERVKLRAGEPCVVLASPDRERATALAKRLASPGNDVIIVDDTDVVASSDMVLIREVRFDAEAFVAITELTELALPWHDLAALLPATHRTRTETTKSVTEKKFALGRAIVTGGLARNKTVTKDVVTRTDDNEPVLYLFRRGRQLPWLLSQSRARFGGLGARLGPIAAPNFAATIDELRRRAPTARFDDRLVGRRGSVADLDLLAHLIATA